LKKTFFFVRTPLFWAITQQVVIIYYRPFGTNYRSHLQGYLKDGTVICPEMSVKNYHYSLRNNPEERSSHLLHSGSLNSRITHFFYCCTVHVVMIISLIPTHAQLLYTLKITNSH